MRGVLCSNPAICTWVCPLSNSRVVDVEMLAAGYKENPRGKISDPGGPQQTVVGAESLWYGIISCFCSFRIVKRGNALYSDINLNIQENMYILLRCLRTTSLVLVSRI